MDAFFARMGLPFFVMLLCVVLCYYVLDWLVGWFVGKSITMPVAVTSFGNS